MTKTPQKEFFPNASENNQDVKAITPIPEQPVQGSSYSLHLLDSYNTKKAKKVKSKKARGNVPATMIYKHGDLKIEMEADLFFNEITDKVHNLALQKQHRTHSSIVYFDLAEYKELTGLKDGKTAAHQLASGIHNLVGMKVSRTNLDKLSDKQKYYEPFTRDTVLYINGGYGSKGYKRGKGFLELNPVFATALDNRTAPMVYPKNQFKYTGTAYHLLGTLVYNFQVNYNHGAKRADRVKMSTVLDHCSNLPSWEDVQKSNRNFADRIIKPLDKALKTLKNDVSCSFLLKDGTPCDSIFNLSLEDFLDCKIVVDEWKSINIDQIDKLKRKQKNKKKR